MQTHTFSSLLFRNAFCTVLLLSPQILKFDHRCFLMMFSLAGLHAADVEGPASRRHLLQHEDICPSILSAPYAAWQYPVASTAWPCRALSTWVQLLRRHPSCNRTDEDLPLCDCVCHPYKERLSALALPELDFPVHVAVNQSRCLPGYVCRRILSANLQKTGMLNKPREGFRCIQPEGL